MRQFQNLTQKSLLIIYLITTERFFIFSVQARFFNLMTSGLLSFVEAND